MLMRDVCQSRAGKQIVQKLLLRAEPSGERRRRALGIHDTDMPGLHGKRLATAGPAQQKIHTNREKQPNLAGASEH